MEQFLALTCLDETGFYRSLNLPSLPLRSVRPLLDMTRARNEFTVLVGQSVTLDCAMAPARPAPNFVWEKDGQRLSGNEEGILIKPGGLLTISLASLEHTGEI